MKYAGKKTLRKRLMLSSLFENIIDCVETPKANIKRTTISKK
jgi:hypothetical protein